MFKILVTKMSLMPAALVCALTCSLFSSSLYAQQTAEKNIVESKQGLVNLRIEVPFVELHSGPSAGYPVVHVIEQNEQVTVLVNRTSWLKVKDKRDNEGWLHEDDLFGLSQQGEAIAQTEISWQDFQNRDIESGVMYGDLEGANFYNIYLGYHFTPVFSAEISAGKALGNISDSNLFEVMLISQPLPDLIVTPYIGVGAGIIDTKPHSVLADSEKRDSTLMSAAAGVKYHLARNFLIRAEYKFSLALTDRDDNEEIQTWKIGFSVFF
ncbi:outer membrane beta-barrel protein [Thalassotalea sp. M1531]|uniref:Outer membrane beta-barrel protein n=1 Tax=Thalassotalea algicola TaxID=2716224 RepID=A0A7Y0Q695_9GAMM|nr:outer membrane beta-barrel protein [Thalassotalea algicola]NMP30587.1 outer membrane beta-barrel protein [Thalassotalea algicola]